MRRALALAPSTRAGLGAAGVLFLAYLATLAPGVTLWDAGELITAMHGVGIPHPPGTPLFVLVGRVWIVLLGALPVAFAANLLSAAATAAACGLAAAMLARWLGSASAGLASGITAGLMATVWRNATETEVYALALLLAVVTLVAAERAGRSDDGRAATLVAYLFGLAIPLHLFALVAAPAAVLLAATQPDGRVRWPRALRLTAAALLAMGVGTLRPALLVAGGALLVGASMTPRREWRPAVVTVAVVALALTPLLVMLLRAQHDPALNQGNPATWQALLDVIGRRQYAVAPLWPRQAPLWLQLGNLFEWADWQVALGLHPEPPPSVGRTATTIAFTLLGALGAITHWRRDRRSARALAVLALAASIGVVLYLNLKVGPSFGVGVVPPDAPREARERDYFFVFAFWVWGLWAGVGALALASRLPARAARLRLPVGIALALLPALLNWRAVDRSRAPDATIAPDFARALLLPLPPRTVLFTAGDNDSYPLWYLQQVEGVRPDVTVLVLPLLPAGWYRAELARREGLVPDSGWAGTGRAARRAAEAAVAQGRPVAASALLGAGWRGEIADGWVLTGAAYLHDPSRVEADGEPGVDRGAAAAALPLVAGQVGDGTAPAPTADPATRQIRRVLACGALAASADPAAGGLLASRCNRR